MRAVLATLVLVLVATAALAGVPVAPVIGGSDAPQGMWPATAAIIYGSASDPAAANADPVDNFECTGVLVAPTVVLTAGHCVPDVYANIGDLTGILIGASNLDDPSQGELIVGSDGDISQYPNSATSIDIGIIKLETPATTTPAPIADGWAKFDIVNGAAVEFVGYGSIDPNGNDYIPQEQEAQSTITDYDCSMSLGCNAAAMPDGELGAGGSGIDTCPGDSGGAMYLLTGYGTFVAGITSRSYYSDTLPCSQGGIYERPDKIVAYIEMATGATLAHGPEPTADPIAVVAGGLGTTTVAANDPKQTDHAYAVTTQPAQGTAAVDITGAVRVCAAAAASGSDSLVVTVTDSSDATRAVPVTIPIAIAAGPAVPGLLAPEVYCSSDKLDQPHSGSGDVDAFPSGGGCDAGGSPSGALALGLGIVAGIVVRGRRHHRAARRSPAPAPLPALLPAPASPAGPPASASSPR